MWREDESCSHFRTGIPPTFSFLYQGWQSIGKAGDFKNKLKKMKFEQASRALA